MHKIREIEEIIRSRDYRMTLGLPEDICETYELLANGEYNINYIFTHPETGQRLLLRLNYGSQMHLNHQISYEFQALEFLRDSGHTPEVLWVSEEHEHGALVETWLPGGHLDYNDRHQMKAVAECLADIHSLRYPECEVVHCNPESVDPDNLKMIAPVSSLEAVLEECESMFSCYEDSDRADDTVRDRIRAMLDNVWSMIGSSGETEHYKCCINTELNSTNFLIDNDHASLVDWEKPLFGDPAQDIGHFLAPTTTFWKTDVILRPDRISRFIRCYIDCVDGRYDTTGLEERTWQFIVVNCMRGLTWCSMAYLEYRQTDRALTSESTRNKLNQYLSDSFLTVIEESIAEISGIEFIN